MPEPYYQEGGITIYHGDCLHVVPRIADPVDLVLTSPPYNLRNGGSLSGPGKEWTALGDGYGSYEDDMPHTQYVDWQQRVLDACWETLSPAGAIYYQHKPIARGNTLRMPFELIPDGIPLRQIVTWDRLSGFCRNLTHYVPSYEWILILAKPEFRLTTRTVDDVWRIPFETGGDHPAPFPLKLARTAIASTQARTVLDPFMGSGTTLRAAKDCGRRAIGIDIEERFCEMAALRMSQEVLDFGATA